MYVVCKNYLKIFEAEHIGWRTKHPNRYLINHFTINNALKNYNAQFDIYVGPVYNFLLHLLHFSREYYNVMYTCNSIRLHAIT